MQECPTAGPFCSYTRPESGVISRPLNFPELQSRIQSGPSLISDRKKNRRRTRKSRTMPGNSTADGGGCEPPPTPEYPHCLRPSFSRSFPISALPAFLFLTLVTGNASLARRKNSFPVETRSTHHQPRHSRVARHFWVRVKFNESSHFHVIGRFDSSIRPDPSDQPE